MVVVLECIERNKNKSWAFKRTVIVVVIEYKKKEDKNPHAFVCVIWWRVFVCACVYCPPSTKKKRVKGRVNCWGHLYASFLLIPLHFPLAFLFFVYFIISLILCLDCRFSLPAPPLASLFLLVFLILIVQFLLLPFLLPTVPLDI